MLEQAAPWTPWSRRAWEPSSILRLRELSEATRWAREGVLSTSAVAWYRQSLRPLIGQDAGLASGAIRSQLDSLLKSDFPFDSQSRRRLDVLIEHADEHYLENWHASLTAGAPVEVERASRFIVGHVIDSGFHPNSVRRTVKKAISEELDTDQIVERLARLCDQPVQTFEGIVPLLDVPQPGIMAAHERWRDPRATNDILRAHEWKARREQSGSLHFAVSARDPFTAALQVHDELQRLVSRTTLLRSDGQLGYQAHWFCTTTKHIMELGRRTDNISVMSPVRTGHLYSGSSSKAIDDALTLASSLKTGPDSIAATSSWAAIEALLSAGSDWNEGTGKTVSADRAAWILTAAWPRAELTALSYQVARDSGVSSAVRHRLKTAGEDNARRCAIVLRALEGGALGPLSKAEEEAGRQRMLGLVESPRRTLRRVEGYIQGAFRRLYRQRNIVLHGGSTQTVALPAAIRTAGPLVGGVLDRLCHGIEVSGREPLDLAAQARTALDAAGDPGGWSLHELLGTE